MLLNYETVLVGENCVLVPYRKEHVGQYHEWMQDAQLLEATASEPLSLQEEYDMQESWRDDPDKCTFIVLARDAIDDKLLEAHHGDSSCDVTTSISTTTASFIRDSLSAMAGDVNMFLSQEEESEQDEDVPEAPTSKSAVRNQAEIDIMIADPKYRRRGLGREATCMMLHYGATHLHLCRIFCKVKDDNESSLQLFKSLGFTQCAYAECFGEVELELKRDSNEELIKATKDLLRPFPDMRSLQCPI